MPVIAIEIVDLISKKVMKIIPLEKRPDVALVYPNIENSEMSGFSAKLTEILIGIESGVSSYKLLLQSILSNQQKIPMKILEFKKINS
ncbi:hypothetical protein [Pleurocapsa sp. PCC 7319]|uniref:hypothetical protein n=1 Tax=Pleurocapsa sp. PCC 7319 TaxID=118161 RepID=UPI00034793B6|nr:hypothetical protein [Pleurocapsa sp. PCC 7319]